MVCRSCEWSCLPIAPLMLSHEQNFCASVMRFELMVGGLMLSATKSMYKHTQIFTASPYSLLRKYLYSCLLIVHSRKFPTSHRYISYTIFLLYILSIYLGIIPHLLSCVTNFTTQRLCEELIQDFENLVKYLGRRNFGRTLEATHKG